MLDIKYFYEDIKFLYKSYCRDIIFRFDKKVALRKVKKIVNRYKYLINNFKYNYPFMCGLSLYPSNELSSCFEGVLGLGLSYLRCFKYEEALKYFFYSELLLKSILYTNSKLQYLIQDKSLVVHSAICFTVLNLFNTYLIDTSKQRRFSFLISNDLIPIGYKETNVMKILYYLLQKYTYVNDRILTNWTLSHFILFNKFLSLLPYEIITLRGKGFLVV